MNFKTTVVLLVLLGLVGAVLLFTRGADEKKDETVTEKKLLDVTAADVNRVAFTNDEGQKTVFERDGMKWRLAEPVKAPAEDLAVGGLVDALVGLQSRGQVDAAPVTGLDSPRFKVEITTKQPKTIKLDVGSRSSAGDNLYVRVDGRAKADVVQAGVYEQLDKPLKDFRRARVFDTTSTDVKQIRVASSQPALAVQKEGEAWRITQPQSMPGDESAVSDVAMAISNLRAEEFVTSQAPDSAELKRFGLDQPVMTVEFSTDAPWVPPATQPTTQPKFTAIQFGRYDDVLKKNVYASISGDPGVFKVPATTLDSFRKKPLELRDKKVVNIESDHVTRISIAIDKPATTQPTTREASSSLVILERTKQQMGPTPPATMPTTMPTTVASTLPTTGPTTLASTQPTTEPVEPPSKWNIASKGNADADDSKVDELLTELHPLRADRYLESVPTTQPSATITLTIETTDARHEIRFTDPGASGGQQPVGSYNGASFEVGRFVLDKFQADFSKLKTPKAPE